MNKQYNKSLFEAKIYDAVHLAQNTSRPRFIGFLDECRAAEVQEMMSKIHFSNYLLYGGYNGAERLMFGAFPDYIKPHTEQFSISAVTATFRTCDKLSHRDFLGALLSNGIERETIGDILVGNGICVFFLQSKIANYILTQISKVGKIGVKLNIGAVCPLPQNHNFKEFSSIVASSRLDCMVAAAIGTSREKASQLIRSGLVMLDHKVNTVVSAQVEQGSKLSVRGKGRFIFDNLGPVTKKGRLSITGRKYI